MTKSRKIPKSIAGVKVPKSLRRGLRDLAASQTGRKALTDALDAAATALTAARAPPPGKAAKHGKTVNADSISETPPDPAAQARAAAVAALEEATRSFTDALQRRGATEAPPPASVTH